MGKPKSKRLKKISKVIGIVSTVFLVLCVGVLIYSTISFSQTGLVKVFGYSFHTIQSESMEPTIHVGDLVIVKQVDYSEINVDDIILFKSEDTSSEVYGRYVVHRVIEVLDGEQGVYRTQGDHNSGPDLVPSKAEGKVVKISSSLGGVFNFVTQGRNILFVIAIFGVVIFGIMQLCSVISDAAKVKEENDKKKLNEDKELQAKLRAELEQELKNETSSSGESNDPPMDDEHKELDISESKTMDDNGLGGDSE